MKLRMSCAISIIAIVSASYVLMTQDREAILAKIKGFIPTFPGDASGDPELQNDTLKNVESNFQLLRIPIKKSCHLEVVDTRLAGPPSNE